MLYFFNLNKPVPLEGWLTSANNAHHPPLLLPGCCLGLSQAIDPDPQAAIFVPYTSFPTNMDQSRVNLEQPRVLIMLSRCIGRFLISSRVQRVLADTWSRSPDNLFLEINCLSPPIQTSVGFSNHALKPRMA